MTYNPNDLIPDDESVQHFLRPVRHLMETPGVTEIAVNDPEFVFFEKQGVWQEIPVPLMNYDNCLALAIAVASYTEQKLTATEPIIGATLPNGERIHMVIPPVVPRNSVSLTIRIPSPETWTMEQYRDQGFYDAIRTENRGLSQGDIELMQLYKERDFMAFLISAVKHRKNIAIVGDTGSGKTTFMKALCQLIPLSDRIITIEDVRELFLLKHRNKVHLTYSTQGKAQIDPAALIKSTMRMKPDRVLPAELRGAEAFDFVDLMTTGHNGSITSFHAESSGVAFERFALMCKKHPNASSYTHSELMRLLHMTIDVIAHIDRVGNKRFISEIYFNPEKKLQLKHG